MTSRSPAAPTAAPTEVALAAKKVVQQTATAPAAPVSKKSAAPAPTPAKADTAVKSTKAKPAEKAAQTKAAAKPAKPAKSAKVENNADKTAKPAKQEKPVAKAVKPVKEAKPKKPKLVRDSFTIPKDEYAEVDTLKLRGAKLDHPVKKSELLRAGLKLLTTLNDEQLLAALQAVPAIKTGRPKADGK